MSEVGQRAGRYTLRHRLGTGGMAEVWLAESVGPAGFQKQVVVKAILPHLASDPEFVKLFLSEARLSAKLNHPNVVQVFELFEENGQYFSVMELVDGGSLRQLMRAARARAERLDGQVVARVLLDACLGLGYVHGLADDQGRALGVVHRDISPDNILLTRSGIAKVADFGIARASNTTSYTRPGSVRGKLSYIPPEVYQGETADPRCDLYALGVVGYEALTGEQPFRAQTEAETINRVVQGVVTPLGTLRPEVPPELSAIIATAMSPSRDRRFPDAAAFARALEKFTSSSAATALSEQIRALIPAPPSMPSVTIPDEDVAVPTGNPVPSATIPRPSPARPIVAGSIAVLFGLSVALMAWKLTRPEPAPKPEPVVAVAEKPKVPEPTPPPPKEEPAPAPTPVVETPPPPTPAPIARTPTPPTRARTGTLVVHAYPWADVIVDSQPRGITPISPLALEPGTHKVTLVNSELSVTKNVQVVVRAGKTASVEVDLSKH